MHPRRSLSVAGWLALGAFSVTACHKRDSSQPSPAASSAGTSLGAASAEPDDQSVSLLGALDVSCESEMTLGAQHVLASLKGRLARQAGVVVSGQPWEVWVLMDTVATARADNGDSRTLGTLPKPFYVSRDSDGNPRKIRLAQEYDAVQRRVLETLVGAVRFAKPPSGKRVWEAHERDNLGWHTASYSLDADGTVARKKLIYDKVHQALQFRVIQSSWRASLDAAGELVSLKGGESLQGKSDPLSVDYEVKLSAVRSAEPVSVVRRALLRIPAEYLEVDFGQAGQKSSREKDDFIAKGKTWDDALQALSVSRKGGPSWEQLYTSAAYLRLHPESVARVVQTVSARPELLANGLALLGETGSEAAQRAIVAWLETAERSDAAQANAILESALRRVGQPLPVLVKYLLNGAGQRESDAQRTFIDAACLLVARASDRGVPEAAGYTQQLIATGRAQSDPASRGQISASLGRIKRPEVLEELLLRSHDEALLARSGAIAGLGTQGNEAAQARLIQLVTKDPTPSLRMAAAQSLSFTGVKQYRAELLRAYRHEPLEIVRIDLVRALGRLVRTEPTMIAALQRARASETSASVRTELERALQKVKDT